MGDSRYVLEPNIKEGKGGLRDLQTLFWIAKYLYQVKEIGELIERGVFTDADVPPVPAALRTSCGRCGATCITSPAARRSA